MNLWEWLFGMDAECVDLFSEDDHLRSLILWPQMVFRNKMQTNIFTAAICLVSMNQIAFIIYVIFWKPELHDVVAKLPSETFISNVQFCMIFMLKIKSLYPEWMEHLNLVLEYSKLCSKELKSRIKFESGLRKFLIYFGIFVFIINYALIVWKGKDSKHFFTILVLEILGNITATEIIFFVLYSYTVFATAILFNLSTYACGHIYFQLLILEENLEKLNCKYTENENYQLHNNQYQKMIKKKLMSCWKHYLNIRRLKFLSNKASYWPIYSSLLHCILSLGAICIYFLLGGHPSEDPGIVFYGFSILGVLVLSSENGQFIKSESLNVHNTLLRTQWYQWNRENRKFLLMFLIATQEPLQITSFGLDQSRDVYVKVFKGLYSVITCINSVRNRATV